MCVFIESKTQLAETTLDRTQTLEMEKTGIESNWTNMEILIVSDFPVRIYFQFAGMEFSIGIE